MATSAQAQVIGVDCLTCMADEFQGRNCTRFLQSFEGASEAHTAILWGVFGYNKTCLRRFTKLPIPVSIEIHPTCGPCRRRPTLYGELVAPGDPKVIRQIRAFADRHPSVRWLLSIELEDDFTPQFARRVYNLIKRNWPYETVRNPVLGRNRAGADYLELHGSKIRCPDAPTERDRRTIADLDGEELRGAAARDFIAANQCRSFLRLWYCSPQGTCPGYRDVADRVYLFSRKLVAELALIHQSTDQRT